MKKYTLILGLLISGVTFGQIDTTSTVRNLRNFSLGIGYYSSNGAIPVPYYYAGPHYYDNENSLSLGIKLISKNAIAYFPNEVPNYDDSTINLQLSQRMAYWIGNAIRVSPEWSNRTAPDIFRAYIGNGHKPDSLFNVTIKAKFLRQGIEALITSRTQAGVADYRSILFNQPSIAGYTGLAAQIIAKANQGDNTAIFIRDWYEGRVATFQALYEQEKAAVVEWSKN